MRKIRLFLVMMCISTALWAGCSPKEKKVEYSSDSTVMKVKDQKITVSEAMLHLLLVKDEMETKWGSKIWDAYIGQDKDGNHITYEQSVKKDVLEELKAEKTLALFAKEKGYSITEEEKEACYAQAAEDIRRFDSGQLVTYGITTEKFAKHFEELVLIEKIYDEVVDTVDLNYEPSDFQVATVHTVLLPTVEILEDGTYGLLDEKTCKKRAAEAAKVQKKLEKSGGTGKHLKKAFAKIEKKYPAVIQKNVAVTKDNFGKEIFGQLTAMNRGGVSNIFKLERGYMIFVVVDPHDEQRTTEAISREIEKQKYKAFEEYYKEEYEDEYHIDLEEAIWEALPFATGNE